MRACPLRDARRPLVPCARQAKPGLLEKLQALQESGAQAQVAALWREARVELARTSVAGAEHGVGPVVSM